MENLIATGFGYTIIIHDVSRPNEEHRLLQAQGLFDTTTEAQTYVDDNAAIRMPTGDYAEIRTLPYTILPLVMQG